MFSILVLVIVVLGVVLDAFTVKKRLTSGLAEVNAKSQVSEAHSVVLPPSTLPEPVASVASISTDDHESSHGDLSSSSNPKPYDDPPLPSGYEYEVFLSFRGVDTRKTFTDCLYRALVNASVNTFRDEEELRTGEEIGPNLLKAIKESKVYIPIFSKNYASSKWCLKELALMWECIKDGKHIILPVFLDVCPNEVQEHTEHYGSALRGHEVKYGSKVVQQWKEALTAVGHLRGMDLANSANGFQGKLIDCIVSDVLSKLKKAQLSVPEKLIGIDYHVKTFKQFHLQLGETDAMILGIYGMGGIGKTTLAKVIYNEILDAFDCCSFIEKFRETSQSKGLNYLQSSLFADLSRFPWSSFEKFRKGSEDLEGLYKGKKVLIFLDDVDDIKDLNELMIRSGSFSRGSRIIITTRDKEVLDTLKVESMYEVEAMDQYHSLQLFCNHAFKQDTPKDGLNDLCNGIVRTTGGLPLALEAIGVHLSNLRIEEWESVWEKLKVNPHEKVQNSLKISYGSLTPAQQTIFLDIACFFIGEKEHTAFSMWNACELFPEDGIRVLRQKCLIRIRDDTTIWMHDQLRDFGREIVRRENYNVAGKRSRLWLGKEAKHVLEYQLGSSKVEAIRVDGSYYVKGEHFKNLLALRFLELNGDILNVNCFANLLPSLLWLRWPFSSFSSFKNLHQPKLVCLDLPYSGLTENWDTMKMEQLKALNLMSSQHLQKTFNFSAFPNLERLILSECKRLEGIDPSLNKLRNLTYLDISGCESIKDLPRKLGSLEKLKVLDMSCCKLLTQIPDAIIRMASLTDLVLDDTGIQELGNYIGQLPKLQRLSLRRCSALTELPETIGHLSKLQTLDLRYCENLEILPALPGSQQGDEHANLIILNISGCQKMKNLPSLCNLKLLKTLKAKGCSKLKELVGLDQLFALQSLGISLCPLIKNSPDFSNFKLLKKLCISGSTMMEALLGFHQMSGLQSLDISHCAATKKSPDLLNFQLLKELRISFCEKLEELIGLDQLSALESLYISHCPAMKHFPDLSKCKLLKELRISFCTNLKEPVGLDQLSALESLYISHCPTMKHFPDLSNCKLLKELRILFCTYLEEPVGLDQLSALESLYISHCPAMKYFPDLSNCKLLKELRISFCTNLKEPVGLDQLSALESLYISHCPTMKHFPDLSNCKLLKELRISFCTNLEEPVRLDQLSALESLYISHCPAMKYFPDLSNCKLLKELRISFCTNLKEPVGLDQLSALESLDISHCPAMKYFSDLSNCKLLKELRISLCTNLEEPIGLDQLSALESFDISHCPAIVKLPEFQAV